MYILKINKGKRKKEKLHLNKFPICMELNGRIQTNLKQVKRNLYPKVYLLY